MALDKIISASIDSTISANVASLGLSGNLAFSGTGNRITGLMNGTVLDRLAFQTSTTNGSTGIYLLPNGTGTVAEIRLSGTADPTNASTGALSIVNGTDVRVQSFISGTGTYLPMTFYTGGSESLRLSATTKTVILSGGSTSADGTGITFPAAVNASSDANTLDDYEEGTWTPTLGGDTGYNQRFGRYVKIGRICWIIGFLWQSGSTGTGSASIVSGLPFTSASVNVYNLSTISMSYWGNLTVGPQTNVIGVVTDNTASMSLTIGGTLPPLTMLQNNAFIYFSGTYQTA